MADSWETIDQPGDGWPWDGTPLIGAQKGDDGGWTCYECHYCDDKGHEGFYLAQTHWTDLHDGRVYPTMYCRMPVPDGGP